MILRSGGFLLVEGYTDRLFVERVLVQEALTKKPGLYVKVVEYAPRTTKRIRGIVNTAKQMGVHYVLLSDLDDFACYGMRRDQRVREFPCLDPSRVVVVNCEIESWYLAGVSPADCLKMGVPFVAQADGITKERFSEMRPRRFNDNLDFMLAILDHYSLSYAVSENRSASLSYFCARHCNLSSAGDEAMSAQRAAASGT